MVAQPLRDHGHVVVVVNHVCEDTVDELVVRCPRPGGTRRVGELMATRLVRPGRRAARRLAPLGGGVPVGDESISTERRRFWSAAHERSDDLDVVVTGPSVCE